MSTGFYLQHVPTVKMYNCKSLHYSLPVFNTSLICLTSKNQFPPNSEWLSESLQLTCDRDTAFQGVCFKGPLQLPYCFYRLDKNESERQSERCLLKQASLANADNK